MGPSCHSGLSHRVRSLTLLLRCCTAALLGLGLSYVPRESSTSTASYLLPANVDGSCAMSVMCERSMTPSRDKSSFIRRKKKHSPKPQTRASHFIAVFLIDCSGGLGYMSVRLSHAFQLL